MTNDIWFIDLLLFIIVMSTVASVYGITKNTGTADLEQLKGGHAVRYKATSSAMAALGRAYPARMIRQAGFVSKRAPEFYWLSKTALALLTYFAGMPWESGIMDLLFLIAPLPAFFLPDLILWQRAQVRKQSIESAMSFFVDQIASFLLCGMTLELALEKATKHGLAPNNALSQEMRLIYSEIASGRPREEALGTLWERTGVKEVHSLVIILNAAFKTGSSVVATLQSQAEILRLRAKEKGLKRISKKLVVAMVPLVVANFPIFLLLVFFTPLMEMRKLFLQFNF